MHKGGDLPKWTNANLEFIISIDLSKDVVVCARI